MPTKKWKTRITPAARLKRALLRFANKRGACGGGIAWIKSQRCKTLAGWWNATAGDPGLRGWVRRELGIRCDCDLCGGDITLDELTAAWRGRNK